MHQSRQKMTLFIVVSSVSATLVAHDISLKRARARALAPVEVVNYIENADLEAVQNELANGTNPNSITGNATEKIAPPGKSLVSLAVLEGYTPIVGALLQHGGLINSPDPDGRTPLITAIHTRSLRMCKKLLEFGANPKWAGSNPGNGLVIESPMDAVVAEAARLKPTLFEPDTKSDTNHDTVPDPRKEVLAIYKLLRMRGVLPTLSQAQEIGDSNVIPAIIASNSTRTRVNAIVRAGAQIHSLPHVE